MPVALDDVAPDHAALLLVGAVVAVEREVAQGGEGFDAVERGTVGRGVGELDVVGRGPHADPSVALGAQVRGEVVYLQRDAYLGRVERGQVRAELVEPGSGLAGLDVAVELVTSQVLGCEQMLDPTGAREIDVWYSRKNREYGGVIQALMGPAAEPLWVSDVLPSSTHDVTAAREFVLAIARHYAAEMPILADCGYEVAGCGVLTPVFAPHRRPPAAHQCPRIPSARLPLVTALRGRSRRIWGAQVLADEQCRAIQRLVGFLQGAAGEGLENVGNAGGDVQDDVHPCRRCAGGHAGGVVQEQFVRSDLQEYRRETGQVCEDRRAQQRLAGILSRQVHGSGVFQRRACEDRVHSRFSLDALASASGVESRRERDDRGGQRQTGIAGCQARGDAQATAGGVACEHDRCGVHTVLQQRTVRAERVLDPGRERVLGGQPVVRRKRPEPGLDHELRRE